ncbi:hypothetical protein ACWEK5_13550 [Rhodococcus koreensis]
MTEWNVSAHYENMFAEAEELALLMHQLGLLSNKESDTVNGHIELANLAREAASSAEGAVEVECRRIGREVADGKIKPSDIAAETLKIADPDRIRFVAERAFIHSVGRAKTAALVNAGRAVEVLNTQLTQLAERAVELAPQLAGVDTADAALAAGRGDAWMEVIDLRGTVARLRGISDLLRKAEVLPKPVVGAIENHWRFRLDPMLTDIGKRVNWRKPANGFSGGGKNRFLAEMHAQPYIPTSREEAALTKRAHETAWAEHRAAMAKLDAPLVVQGGRA